MTNIVITGCSTGIGLETAKYLKHKDIKVYPTARDEAEVQTSTVLGKEPDTFDKDAIYFF